MSKPKALGVILGLAIGDAMSAPTDEGWTVRNPTCDSPGYL